LKPNSLAIRAAHLPAPCRDAPGRIEAADGGTLFLDEIGEMPLGLQSKLLRFVECGELQRVGDNETVKVDVRIIAATHRPLAAAGADRRIPLRSLLPAGCLPYPHPGAGRAQEDLPLLVEHFLEKMGRDAPVKRVDEGALAKLARTIGRATSASWSTCWSAA
jgi:DNA-binding NtrC family response regulator